MNQVVSDITKWLEQNTGSTLIIQKRESKIGTHETMDIDKVRFELERISTRTIERPDPDYYLANQEVILHGKGKIITDKGEIDIPQDVYEVPVYKGIKATIAEKNLTIEMEKANYSIIVH
ncbi:hypothetical protein BHU72_05780 [Desulfuribacillus stibiiarsenatis]|uniref:Uncharacterized protein n=1 Tax=Desulfuribacillus stibiiarsenatis TaxID=1390249 RepID=A0A1E5L4T3_9FIRM|nr:hypothetical protein [Desulfuribacillus stibiiarsenatis]OEH85120.1 hypothetical protein BHU72_05780 [Desulfuribacillus stibiiarsenatis]